LTQNRRIKRLNDREIWPLRDFCIIESCSYRNCVRPKGVRASPGSPDAGNRFPLVILKTVRAKPVRPTGGHNFYMNTTHIRPTEKNKFEVFVVFFVSSETWSVFC
jgi:hypothetical protein